MYKQAGKTGTGVALLWAGFLAVGVLLGGCRAHPISLGTMLVGDMINDADVKKRAEKLMNQPVTAADDMFGARLETLEDTTGERERVLYPVKMDLLNSERYAVEVVNNTITAVSRMKRNIDGSENVLKQMQLEDKLMGKNPKECEEAAEFESPVLIARSKEKVEMVHVYDVRNWTNTRGARYCLLRFDKEYTCTAIEMIGVSASTREDPAARSTEK
jgi:hypothetical protein